jgi:probable HAF family extracellular repeat protein
MLTQYSEVLAARAWVPTANTSGAQATGNFVALTSYNPHLPAPSGPPEPPADRGLTSTAIFNELTSAWAEAVVPVGQTVAITALPDVANEKSGSRAKLVLTRTGTAAALAAALAVRISLPVNNPAGTPFIRRATYGTSGSADYFFDWSSATYLASVPAEINRPVTGTTGKFSRLPTNTDDGYVVFPAGSDRVIVDVVPRADEVFERETAYVQLGDPLANTPSANEPYRVVQPKDAAVILYDGPTWTLVGGTSMVYDTYQSTYKQATAALAWALNQETTPKVAGWAQLPAVYGQAAYQKLGWWNPSTANYINELFAAPTVDGNGLPLDRWFGLSTTTPTMVGQINHRAYKWQIGGSGSYPSVQPAIPSQPPPGFPSPVYFRTDGGSAIFGVSVNNTYMAGKATPTTPGAFARPMRWENGNPVDLVGSSPSFTSGEARGVDSTGTTVGHVNLNYSKRAFRVSDGTINTSEVLPPHRLGSPPPNQPVNILWDSWAYGIAPRVNGNVAMENVVVGSASVLELDTANTPETTDDIWIIKNAEVATYWNPGSANASRIGLLPGHTVSRATAINDGGEVVGWSGTSESFSRAFVCRTLGGQPVDLNDKHFIHNLSGWSTLEKAYGVNNAGWVVGEGLRNGQRRGFLLRKLSNP